MKLKYYLRGIGIGVILTALIMGFALGGRKTTISDAEVIERAKKLGMVQGGVLSIIQMRTTALIIKTILLHPIRKYLKKEKKYLKKTTKQSLYPVRRFQKWIRRKRKLLRKKKRVLPL